MKIIVRKKKKNNPSSLSYKLFFFNNGCRFFTVKEIKWSCLTLSITKWKITNTQQLQSFIFFISFCLCILNKLKFLFSTIRIFSEFSSAISVSDTRQSLLIMSSSFSFFSFLY